jgi:Fic family protein
MTYNWQQKDWCDFKFSKESLKDKLFEFAQGVSHQKGMLKAMPTNSQEEALLQVMISEALNTSAIENEYLSREDVQSSICNNLGIYQPLQNVKDKRAEGIGKLTATVRAFYTQRLTEQTIKSWHQYLFPNRTDITVGEWRKSNLPMQVVSGRIDKPIVHFEAPPSKRVPVEMAQFVKWFNATSPNGTHQIKEAPVRAAIAHLYFESIHPFEDGNGRIGRAIADKALSQTLAFPILISLSATFERHKKAYYAALEQAQKSNNVTDWIIYFIDVILEAQSDAEQLIEFTIKKSRFFDAHKIHLNARQIKVVNRMFAEGPDGFKGGMSAKKYMSLTKTSKATATRDLQILHKIGAFKVEGAGRNTRYDLNLI